MIGRDYMPNIPEEPGSRRELNQLGYCAHRSGIERVEVTQPQGATYEWWRCMICHCEFRPTGEVRSGEA